MPASRGPGGDRAGRTSDRARTGWWLWRRRTGGTCESGRFRPGFDRTSSAGSRQRAPVTNQRVVVSPAARPIAATIQMITLFTSCYGTPNRYVAIGVEVRGPRQSAGDARSMASRQVELRPVHDGPVPNTPVAERQHLAPSPKRLAGQPARAIAPMDRKAADLASGAPPMSKRRSRVRFLHPRKARIGLKRLSQASERITQRDGFMTATARHPQSILVTGAAGFIGSSLVDRLLQEGRDVCGLDNFDSFYARGIKERNLENARMRAGFRLAEGDLRDEAFLSEVFSDGQFDAVVHLAARAGVRPSIEAPGEYYDCNVMGTVRLLETMRRFGVGALVYASSSSVYGERDGSGPFKEVDTVDRPLSPYAATKRAGELLCHTYWHLHDLHCYCLRFFTVYGPRQRPDLAVYKFTRALSEGRPIPFFGDGSTERDYTYVDDVVDGTCKALDRVGSPDGASFEILNIGTNRPIRLSDLVRLLGEAMEAEPSLERLPCQSGDVSRTWADIARAHDILGYEPKVSIEEGLRRFVAWYLERHSTGAVTKCAAPNPSKALSGGTGS